MRDPATDFIRRQFRKTIPALVNDLNSKANASTVGGLATAIDSKASASSVAAIAAAMPVISSDVPLAESVTPTAGVDGPKVPGSKHQHPRLASATRGTITIGNTAVVPFTRSFASEPTIDYCELPPTATTTTPVAADLAATAQPTTAKVIAWSMDGSNQYTGCTIRVFKSQTIPQNLVALLVGAVFNLFGASVVGTRFSIIALARTDA